MSLHLDPSVAEVDCCSLNSRINKKIPKFGSTVYSNEKNNGCLQMIKSDSYQTKHLVQYLSFGF